MGDVWAARNQPRVGIVFQSSASAWCMAWGRPQTARTLQPTRAPRRACLHPQIAKAGGGGSLVRGRLGPGQDPRKFIQFHLYGSCTGDLRKFVPPERYG